MSFFRSILSVLFAILIFICFSCKDKTVNTKPLDIASNIKGMLVFDSLPIPADRIERVCARPIIDDGGKLKGYGIFQRHSDIVAFTNENGKLVDTMKLLSNGNSELIDIYFKGMDSLYSYWDYKSLILSNKKQILSAWELDATKTSGYYAYTFGSASRLNVLNTNLVMMLVNMPTDDALQDISGVNSGKPTLGYFKLDSTLISLQSEFGIYASAKRFDSLYYDFFSLFSMLGSTSVVYCNQHENIIYLYNLNSGETKRKVLKSCCFIPGSPMPPDSMISMSFTIQYEIENARNIALLSDPFRHYIYRVHSIKPPQTPEDEVAMIEDCPLILTVLNTDLEIIGEYELPQRKYNPAHFMVIPSGLLLRTISKKRLEYDVFVP